MDMDMDMDMNDHGESDDTNGDGEGVWSPDIEQCFREALLLFPPCGRRKHILQEEGGGKMYGRNELIARHIMMRTGKSRTRKQVSSHIQVLARRKAKAEAATLATGVSPSPSGMRTQPPHSATGLHDTHNHHHNNNNNNHHHHQQHHHHHHQLQHHQSIDPNTQQSGGYYDVWVDRPIVSQKIRLVEFSAFIEYRNFQPDAPIGVSGPVTLQQQVPIQATTLTSGAVNIPADLQTTTGTAIEQQLAAVQASASHLQQQQPFTPNSSQQHIQQTPTHPLASNHHLPAQFNQASYHPHVTNNQLQPQIHQKSLSTQAQANHCITINNQQLQHASAGFTRHSYVQIDYRQTLGRQTNKLERIDISQIQDKFPEIGGSEGLFQRGPSDAFFLVKFWADLNNDYEYNIDDQNSYFGFSSHFETVDPYKDITCSTKACSYGLQVVEKVEKINGAFNSSNGRYSYHINRSPMCEFMIQFIKKLRQLPRASQMNSVLENFTVLQVITSESTSEILLCLAYVFEVASIDQINGPQYHVYKLTKD